jgi:peptidoglycan-N-acetylglucosamine deacetylase
MTVYVTTSWDDGNELDIRLLKLMNKYGIKGTFYIPIKSDRTNLTKKEIKEISKTQEIGAHTLNHIELANNPYNIQLKEISESKKQMEKITGKPIKSFCYPRGSFDGNSIRAVKESNLKYARTTERFCFKPSKNPLRNGTTCQTIIFKADVFKFLKINNFNPLSLQYVFNWNYFAEKMFLHAKKTNGIFHLWGHSWEIDEFNQWNKLERFFKFLSKQTDVEFITNIKTIA